MKRGNVRILQYDAPERVIADLAIGRITERQGGDSLQKDVQFL